MSSNNGNGNGKSSYDPDEYIKQTILSDLAEELGDDVQVSVFQVEADTPEELAEIIDGLVKASIGKDVPAEDRTQINEIAAGAFKLAERMSKIRQEIYSPGFNYFSSKTVRELMGEREEEIICSAATVVEECLHKHTKTYGDTMTVLLFLLEKFLAETMPDALLEQITEMTERINEKDKKE